MQGRLLATGMRRVENGCMFSTAAVMGYVFEE